MENFTFFTNTKIYFGENSISNLSQIINENFNNANENFNNALIVTGKNSAKQNGFVDTVVSQLKKNNIKSYLYNNISPNPRIKEVDEAVGIIKNKNIDLVIGLGGGSSLDAAKAIAAIPYAHGTATEVFYGSKKLSNKKVKLIQIPTTSGTGSELSMGSILTDEAKTIKSGLRGEVLLADIAVVDPTLTYTKPRNLSMETGFDILTHAIETYLSKKSNPITEAYSVIGIQKVFKYLPKLNENLDDKEARNQLSFASLLMGINLANSSTCLPHRLQYPVGALTDTSHPRGLAAIYASWLDFSKVYNKNKFLKLVKELNYEKGDDKSLDCFINDINLLLKNIELDINLTSLGIKLDDIPLLISRVSGSLDNDPVGLGENVVEKIYYNSL